MKHPKTKTQQTPKIIAITLIGTLITTACTTTKPRDERLIENLEKQNAVIEATIEDRQAPELKAELEKSDPMNEAEDRLVKALGAIKSSNEIVIGKIKPDKKECTNGKNKGDGDDE